MSISTSGVKSLHKLSGFIFVSYGAKYLAFLNYNRDFNLGSFQTTDIESNSTYDMNSADFNQGSTVKSINQVFFTRDRSVMILNVKNEAESTLTYLYNLTDGN